jgi:hypothetical protein
MMRYSVALFAFLVALAAADRNQQAPKKVRLRDLSAITLHADRQTSARRSSPIPQLECVGGDACHDFQPKVVRVSNNYVNCVDRPAFPLVFNGGSALSQLS